MEYTETEREAFKAQYIDAMVWADFGEEGQPETEAEFSQEAIARIERDCERFLSIAPYFEGIETLTNAAHDFWLTRQGHGAGFWDGDWPQDMVDKCCAACATLKAVDVYQGDDGLVYFL